MAHVNRVRCVDISEERIPVNFEEAYVNVVAVIILKGFRGRKAASDY